MTEEFRRLAGIATGQHGVVTASQIGAAGITPGQLRRRVQSGILQPSGVHTYRDPLVDRTVIGDLVELVIDCGRDTFVSGPTAAALHGFDGFRLWPPFHVTVLRGRNVQRAHHHVHTTLHSRRSTGRRCRVRRRSRRRGRSSTWTGSSAPRS